jgi:hypothetical protein
VKFGSAFTVRLKAAITGIITYSPAQKLQTWIVLATYLYIFVSSTKAKQHIGKMVNSLKSMSGEFEM